MNTHVSKTVAAIVGFLGCILAANYVTTRYGFVPVGFGLTATAGTYFAGASFVLRDAVQDTVRSGLTQRGKGPWGIPVTSTPRDWVVAAHVIAVILVGAGLSLLLALTVFRADSTFLPPGVTAATIAIASGVAFLFGETLDLAVYTPLRKRGYVRAAVASNIVGAIVDTYLFLTVSGFGLTGWQGQIVGKLAVTGAVIAVVGLVRPIVRRRRLRASLKRGLEQSADGDVRYLGLF